MKQKYTTENLHPIRHMDEYVDEIEAGSVSPYRTNVLMKRFAEVKKLSYEMYKDCHNLIIEIDGEIPSNPELLWKHDLESVRLFSKAENHSYGDYSDDKLHAIRHFEEYVEEIETGNVSNERSVELKDRLGTVLRTSVRLYYDAERLIRLLD